MRVQPPRIIFSSWFSWRVKLKRSPKLEIDKELNNPGDDFCWEGMQPNIYLNKSTSCNCDYLYRFIRDFLLPFVTVFLVVTVVRSWCTTTFGCDSWVGEICCFITQPYLKWTMIAGNSSQILYNLSLSLYCMQIRSVIYMYIYVLHLFSLLGWTTDTR